jgi:hypothetical protein
VDGLERRLQEENNPVTPTSENTPSINKPNEKVSSIDNLLSPNEAVTSMQNPVSVVEQAEQTSLAFADRRGSILLTPTYNGFGDHTLGDLRHQQQTHRTSRQDSTFLSDAILDTYFSRIHGKPFYILEESSTRQKHHMGQLPAHLTMAIYAITVRYIFLTLWHLPDTLRWVQWQCGSNTRVSRYAQSSEGQESLTRSGLKYALKARQEVDIDNPTIEGLQTLLLLSMVFFAYGLGKKTYMTLCMINLHAMIVLVSKLISHEPTFS